MSNGKFTLEYILKENIDTRSEDVYVKALIYPFVIPLSWLLLNFTTVSANQVTLAGLFSGVLGCLLSLATSNLSFMGAGFLLFFVCDFIDGRIAMARGGGTYMGTILDLTTDRTILLLSTFTLAVHHYLFQQYQCILLVMSYFMLYEFIDMLTFVSLKAKVRFNRPLAVSRKTPFAGNTLRNNLGSLWVWVPTRLSSSVLGISVYLATGSFLFAYGVAIAGALFDYLRMALSLSWKPLARSQA